MLVNFSPRMIFIKTPKTAGTTTEAVLQEAAWGESAEHDQDWQVSRAGFCTPRVGVSEDLSRSRELGLVVASKLPFGSLGHIRRLRNHSPAHAIRRAVGEKFWNESLKIVNVRNPFDMAVSAYYFRFRHRTESARPPFNEWIERTGTNASTKWIESVDSTWRLIRYESLESDITAVLDELGFPAPPSLPAFKSGIRPSEARDYRAMFTPGARATIEASHAAYLKALSYEF